MSSPEETLPPLIHPGNPDNPYAATDAAYGGKAFDAVKLLVVEQLVGGNPGAMIQLFNFITGVRQNPAALVTLSARQRAVVAGWAAYGFLDALKTVTPQPPDPRNRHIDELTAILKHTQHALLAIVKQAGGTLDLRAEAFTSCLPGDTLGVEQLGAGLLRYVYLAAPAAANPEPPPCATPLPQQSPLPTLPPPAPQTPAMPISGPPAPGAVTAP